MELIFIHILGKTPLIEAAIIGHIDIVKWLISNNADVNAVDEDGVTALDCAYANEHDEVIKYLEENGGLRKNKLKNGRPSKIELMVEEQDPVSMFLNLDNL